MSNAPRSVRAAPEGTAGEVFLAFLRLGLTSFGGPIAHLGYFRDDLVVRRKWVDDKAYADLVATFYEVHDPTQGYRQGNDVGTQYRSAIYVETPEQEKIAHEITERYQPELTARGYGPITTEIRPAAETAYYYAEDLHQQYLLKNPYGYRCHSATGIRVPRA